MSDVSDAQTQKVRRIKFCIQIRDVYGNGILTISAYKARTVKPGFQFSLPELTA